MARTIPAQITAALAAPSATPTLVISSQDLPTRLAQLAITGAPPARTAALLTSAHTLLRAAVSQDPDPNTVTVFRITTLSSAAQWTAAGAIVTSNAMASAGCALVQTGATIRLFYVDSATTVLCYRDSTNDGVTWSAETQIAPAPLIGLIGDAIAAIDTTHVLAAYHLFPYAGDFIYELTFAAGVWSAYTSVGPATPQWGQIRGLSAAAATTTTVLLGGVQMRAQISGIAMAATTITAGVFTPWISIAPMDTPTNGLSNANPSVHYDPGTARYYAVANLHDDGSITGAGQSSRATVFSSPDGLTWSLATALGTFFTYETHWVYDQAGNAYAFDNTGVYLGPPAAGAETLTTDAYTLLIQEHPNQPTQFTITIDNRDGQWTAHPALRDNAQVQISYGYNGTTIPTHTAFIDAVEYTATPDSAELIVKARDLQKFLDQINNTFTALASKTIGDLITTLASSALVPLAALPGTPQFSQVVPCLILVPGETWHTALLRVASIYDFQIRSDATPQIVIQERASGDVSSWAYGQGHLGAAWQQSADQPNVIRVVGASSADTNVFAEAVDSTSIHSSGVHRYRHIFDRMCDTAAKCLIKAQLALRDDQAKAATGTITVRANPRHELLDVITITEPRLALAGQNVRITGILTTIDHRNAQCIQQLDLELP